MKRILGLLILGMAWAANAQFLPTGAMPAGFERFLMKAFDSQPLFMSTATVHILDTAQDDLANINCELDGLNGNLYVKMNSFFPGTNVGTVADLMKQMNSTTILRPDLKREFLLFPTFRSYVEMALPVQAPGEPEPYPHITKLDLGPETLASHPCQKTQWTLTDSSGNEQKLLVWTANDLQHFPLVIKFAANTNTVEMDFQNVDFTPPVNTLFAVPLGYVKYSAIQSQIVSNIALMTNATNVSPSAAPR